MPKIKNFLIGLMIILLILFLIGFFLFKSKSSDNQNNNQATIEIIGKEKEKIKVNNFYLLSKELFEGGSVVVSDSNSVIMYNDNSKFFTILVNANDQNDFDLKQPAIEDEFIKILGVTKTEACDLNVEVSASGSDNGMLSMNEISKLSFCK